MDDRALNLRASEILESIPEGFFTLDGEFRFDYVNLEAARLLERPSEELVGRVVWEAFPELESTEFSRGYQQAMSERQKVSFTTHYAPQQRWYEVTAYPAAVGIAVCFRDVTQQKTLAAERETLITELERQKRMYDAALSSTPDLVYIFNLEHRFIYANDALLKMWGLTWEEASQRDWAGLGYEKWHADMHDRELAQVIATRKPVRGEVPFNGSQGRRIHDYIFVPVLNEQGEVVAIAGTTRDVTERQQAERAKDEFLATLAHELRNPLAPLRNAIALMKMRGGEDRIHEMMERQVDHLVRLVDDLLEVSRITHGNFSLHKERVELAPLVRNAIDASKQLIQAGKHQLHISIPKEPLVLDADPVRLSQIVSNLLNNAAKYTEEGGHIEVIVKAEPGHASIMVRDNGAGIPPASIERMFQMFTRGQRLGDRSAGGLGIGLALARRLAEMHGGTLQARSAGRGEGSEFTLRVPLLLAEVAPVPVAPPVTQLNALRILVVDDNIDAAESLGMLLELQGATVYIAHDGASALQAFATHRPGVVLLDIGMPGMDGYEVARAMRARHPHESAKIIALTGWGQEQDRRAAHAAGFDHHMVKPVDPIALQALLTR